MLPSISLVLPVASVTSPGKVTVSVAVMPPVPPEEAPPSFGSFHSRMYRSPSWVMTIPFSSSVSLNSLKGASVAAMSHAGCPSYSVKVKVTSCPPPLLNVSC